MKHAGLVLISLLAATAAIAQTEAELAKAEPPMTAHAVTVKLVDTVEAFSAQYRLSVTGKKVNATGGKTGKTSGAPA